MNCPKCEKPLHRLACSSFHLDLRNEERKERKIKKGIKLHE